MSDDMRNAELNNGRAAMFAAVGIIAAELATGNQGFQGYGVTVDIPRIRYLVPRMLFCVVSCLAILRIGGSLNSTL